MNPFRDPYFHLALVPLACVAVAAGVNFYRRNKQ